MAYVSGFEFIPIEKLVSLPESGNYQIRKDYYYLLIDGNLLRYKYSYSLMCNPNKIVIDSMWESMSSRVFKDLKVEIIQLKYTFQEI